MGMCLGRMGRHGEWHGSRYPSTYSNYPTSSYDAYDYPPTVSSGVIPTVGGVSAHVNPRYATDDYYYNGGGSSGGYLHESRGRPASIGHHTYHSGHGSYRDGVYHDPYY